MIVQLREDMRIESDAHCWQLQVRKVAEKSGNVRWQTLGYYSLLSNALRAAVTAGLRFDEASVDVCELADRIDRWILQIVESTREAERGLRSQTRAAHAAE